MKIHCFGASVTAQNRHHDTGEIVGYTCFLREKLNEILPVATMKVTAAGSSHFDDAGYCLLPEIVAQKPDLLLLEWHTTWLERFDEEFWHGALAMLRAAGIITLIVILPRKGDFMEGVLRPNVQQALESSGNGVFLTDLRKAPGFDPDIHLRDDVHTTGLGARFYADFISRVIISIVNDHLGCRHSSDVSKISCLPSSTKVPSVNKLMLGEGYSRCTSLSIAIEPDFSCSPENIRLVFDQKIGPFSPVVKMSLSPGNVSIFSLWDPWCSYTRLCYRRIPFKTKKDCLCYKIQFDVLDVAPEYSSCRSKEFDFQPFTDRYILVRSLYAIGANIRLES